MNEVQTPQAAPVFANEDAVLDYTLDMRKKLMQAYIDPVTGEVSGDLDTRRFILQNLDGMERQALGRKKIKTEEKGQANAAEARALVAELLRQAPNAVTRIGAIIEHESYAVPVLPSSVPPPELTSGETDIGVSSLDFDTFMANKPQME